VPFRTFHRRTPQKRFYIQGAEYFVTSVTHERYPHFSTPRFAQSFVEDLWFACELKELELFGYTVIPEHVHILFQPVGRSNYSEVIGSLKRNVARDVNDLISGQPFVRNLSVPPEGDSPSGGNDSNVFVDDDSNRRLRRNFQITKQNHPHLTFETYKNHFDRLESIRRSFETSKTETIDLPQFRWQKSFRDHLIRNQQDFDNHIEYIYNNALKHGLPNAPHLWPWMWVVGMPPPLRQR
jgi:REP element-mobilizing transposase RayT